MIIPVVLTVVVWTVTDNYKYTEFFDLFNCPDLVSIHSVLNTGTCNY